MVTTLPNTADTARDLAECLAILREAQRRVEALEQLPPESLAPLWAESLRDREAELAPLWLKEDARGLGYNLAHAIDALDGLLPPDVLDQADGIGVELAGADAPAVVRSDEEA